MNNPEIPIIMRILTHKEYYSIGLDDFSCIKEQLVGEWYENSKH